MKCIYLVVVIFLLTSANSVLSQTACPSGVAPGSPQCGPDSGTSRGDLPIPPPRPTGEWLKTWGAIATSESTGEAGTSANKFSEKDARNSAINQCALGGASDCKVHLVYRNQCASFAASHSDTFFQAAESKEVAIELAKRNCEKSGTGSCKVMYSDCTEPVFKKY
ncbi:DUF4189 domain-containing protein [Xanthomonas campestris]|uniref:DUF4189 domain-containing protein n=1 Tax=Xanthomonas campestris TaxID=339 RepID=UPI002B232A1B|nr:DUF4189 domain-containing protein [Xanthomonas campestris]MEA9830217.1 DUF4189 domain-containing protein [Xanthomonas campestris pv. raphani]MEA9923257.1 DUF4189 domain-containing protein [Xanthomonas campestris pv. raphani]MEA9955193.1 DUF4189 domain-containing protein [Xanthomonas campestris pv. raphani]MEC5197782.1 hypothetical protein [Xanthomonas campestris]